MDVSLFAFDLPDEHIALRPASPRDDARGACWCGAARKGILRFEHAHMRDLPDYLDSGDALVINDTKVIAARLRGRAPHRPRDWAEDRGVYPDPTARIAVASPPVAEQLLGFGDGRRGGWRPAMCWPSIPWRRRS